MCSSLKKEEDLVWRDGGCCATHTHAHKRNAIYAVQKKTSDEIAKRATQSFLTRAQQKSRKVSQTIRGNSNTEFK